MSGIDRYSSTGSILPSEKISQVYRFGAAYRCFTSTRRWLATDDRFIRWNYLKSTTAYPVAANNREVILRSKLREIGLGPGNSRMSRDPTWMLAAFLTAGNAIRPPAQVSGGAE